MTRKINLPTKSSMIEPSRSRLKRQMMNKLLPAVDSRMHFTAHNATLLIKTNEESWDCRKTAVGWLQTAECNYPPYPE